MFTTTIVEPFIPSDIIVDWNEFKKSPRNYIEKTAQNVAQEAHDYYSGKIIEISTTIPMATIPDPVLLESTFIPPADSTFVLDENKLNLFKSIEKASHRSPQNVLLVGPHGCGKTESAIQFAARYKRPILIMDCAHTREACLWWGRMHAKEGTTYFSPSDFFNAVEAGGHVIVLDEINRVGSNILSPLMPLLDARRLTYVPDTNRILRVGPNTIFFATMNVGSQYTGTSDLDLAIEDRFVTRIEVTYLNPDDERKVIVSRTGITDDNAKKLVDIANMIRKKATGFGATLSKTISTRQLLGAAILYKDMGINALDFTLANHFSAEGGSDSERRQVLQMIQGKFGS